MSVNPPRSGATAADSPSDMASSVTVQSADSAAGLIGPGADTADYEVVGHFCSRDEPNELTALDLPSI